MKLLTKQIIKSLPKLRATEKIAIEDKKIILKFFDPTGSWTWYVVEGESIDNSDDFMFFGLVDGFEREWGYFTLAELRDAKKNVLGVRGLPIERDLWFSPILYKDLKSANRW